VSTDRNPKLAKITFATAVWRQTSARRRWTAALTAAKILLPAAAAERGCRLAPSLSSHQIDMLLVI
jgi:hypothetical protein